MPQEINWWLHFIRSDANRAWWNTCKKDMATKAGECDETLENAWNKLKSDTIAPRSSARRMDQRMWPPCTCSIFKLNLRYNSCLVTWWFQIDVMVTHECHRVIPPDQTVVKQLNQLSDQFKHCRVVEVTGECYPDSWLFMQTTFRISPLSMAWGLLYSDIGLLITGRRYSGSGILKNCYILPICLIFISDIACSCLSLL